MDFGCASYCAYAEQCIGNLPPELIAQKENLLKDRVAIEMKRYFRKDFKRIGHAMRVARHAEQIGREEGGNLAVILCAAYLKDVSAEDGGGEKVAAARDILTRLQAREELINEVCGILGNHDEPRENQSINFKCVQDADVIADLIEKQEADAVSFSDLEKAIEKSVLTTSGRTVARKLLFKSKE
jgi:HD superfamily phosphodiesterase